MSGWVAARPEPKRSGRSYAFDSPPSEPTWRFREPRRELYEPPLRHARRLSAGDDDVVENLDVDEVQRLFEESNPPDTTTSVRARISLPFELDCRLYR